MSQVENVHICGLINRSNFWESICSSYQS